MVQRTRRKNLLIVEGNHEKNELFAIVRRCFPELGIDPQDIWIYGTNIYALLAALKRAYGADWDQQDIDLPFVISTEETPESYRYKRNYLNILLIFDYERQDPQFDAEAIARMQEYFSDPADVGKLYLNYPMVESYQHFLSFPDPDFRDRHVPADLQRGGEYKRIMNDLPMTRCINFYNTLPQRLNSVLGTDDTAENNAHAEALLNCSNNAQLEETSRKIASAAHARQTDCSQYLTYLVTERSYISEGINYWTYMRRRFAEIIRYNICKANWLTGGAYHLADNALREAYEALSLSAVLKRQNTDSADVQQGYIWVLNTCLFFVADYRFSLIEPDKFPL